MGFNGLGLTQFIQCAKSPIDYQMFSLKYGDYSQVILICNNGVDKKLKVLKSDKSLYLSGRFKRNGRKNEHEEKETPYQAS